MANTNTRIIDGMTLQEILITMSEGNPGALTCMIQMLNSDLRNFSDILLFDKMGIYGSQIYIVWNDCCNRDMRKFKETIQAFREGKFTEEEIQKNLARPHAQPFI